MSFEGHRYGVPYWYGRRECRVSREGRVVHIYSDDLSRELVAHAVGAGADSWCEGQWETSPAQPEELPTQPVGTVVEQIVFLIAFIFRKSRDKSFGFHDDCFAS